MVKNVKEIVALDILSVALIQSLVLLLFGLLLGIITLVVAYFKSELSWVVVLSNVVLAPIFYGVLGFVGGAITALFYNMFSSKVGGIKITLK